METIIMGLYRVGEYRFHSAGQGKLVHIVQQQLSKIRVVLLFHLQSVTWTKIVAHVCGDFMSLQKGERSASAMPARYYGSLHFLFHYSNITPIQPQYTIRSSFHFLFHYPNITPM